MNLSDNIIPILEEEQSVEGFEVLSLGCGIGISEKNERWACLMGMDAFDYSKGNYLDVFMRHDIRTVREVIKDKSFDLVLCLDVIEHLTHDEGLQLIEDSEALAKFATVFYTPFEWTDNSQAVEGDPTHWAYGNSYNYHKSLWKPEEFFERGYTGYKIFFTPSETPDGFLGIKWLN